MIVNEWTEILVRSFQGVLDGVVSFLPNLVMAILVVLIGWVIAIAIEKIIEQTIKYVRLDRVLASAGLETVVQRAGFKLNTGKFIGGLVKWFAIVVFLITAFEILGLNEVNNFLTGVVIGYIPRVIAAVLILLIAVVVGDVLQKTVIASAKAAELRSANFLGSMTKWSIWVFAILASLVQLGIGAIFIQTLFNGVIAALAIAIGLSLGLGGKEVASQAIQKIKEEVTSKE